VNSQAHIIGWVASLEALEVGPDYGLLVASTVCSTDIVIAEGIGSKIYQLDVQARRGILDSPPIYVGRMVTDTQIMLVIEAIVGQHAIVRVLAITLLQLGHARPLTNSRVGVENATLIILEVGLFPAILGQVNAPDDEDLLHPFKLNGASIAHQLLLNMARASLQTVGIPVGLPVDCGQPIDGNSASGGIDVEPIGLDSLEYVGRKPQG
jgi:hypothetical protein